MSLLKPLFLKSVSNAKALAIKMNFKELNIIDKRNLTPLCVEFTFELPKKFKRSFNPQAGQYVTLKISDEKVTQARNYSISKFNPEQNTFSIAVKRVEKGWFSNRLINGFQIGDKLQISEPQGDFLISKKDLKAYKQFVFLSGGSGITPMLNMLAYLKQEAYTGDVILIYGNKNEEEIIYKAELDQLQKEWPNFKIIYGLEESPSEAYEKCQLTVSCLKGLFEKYQIKNANSCFLASGPPIIIDNLRIFLQENKVKLTHLKFEKFFIELDLKTTQQQIEVEINKEQKQIVVAAQQTLLDACLNAGLPIEHNCKSGSCRSCQAIVKKGEVFPHSKSRKVLTCQTGAHDSNLKLSFDIPLIQSLWSDRNLLIATGMLLALLLLIPIQHPDNEVFLAKGEFNTGHEDLSCVQCHSSADGTLRQQLQHNTKELLQASFDFTTFGNKKVDNQRCLECHQRPNDRHPTHRFNEPRFKEAVAQIQAQNCTTCHGEHLGRRVKFEQVDFCVNCHSDTEIKNDPIDFKHADLILQNKWDTCIQCHDFHGNHEMQVPVAIKDTISKKELNDYYRGGADPFGDVKTYMAILNE